MSSATPSVERESNQAVSMNGWRYQPEPSTMLTPRRRATLRVFSGWRPMSRFVVSTRWRLHKQFPKELAEAERPFVDLVRGEVNAAIEAGLLNPPDPEWDSWFVTELVRSVYHYYAFAPHEDEEIELVKERMWRFCLTAPGGTPDPG